MVAAPVLSEKDYRELKTALAHIVDNRELLDTARRAGLDVENEWAMLEAAQFKVESILKEYFPNRP